MVTYSCILCLGSNFDRSIHMKAARHALSKHFPDIRFSNEMETEAIGEIFLSPFSNQVAILSTPLSADEVRLFLKHIEAENGRLPSDKTNGIVKLDIDLLSHNGHIYKPLDLEKEYVQKGLKELTYYNS